MQGQVMDEPATEPSGPRGGGDLPADAFTRHLRAAPRNRAEVVERARHLLAGGLRPSDDDVATVLAGWLAHTRSR